MSDLGEQPPKLVFVDLESGDEVQAQFNPEELRETLAANYAEIAVLGQSHTRMHFAHTATLEENVTLHWWARSPDELAALNTARRRIASWCYPRRAAAAVGAAAPRVLMVWPGVLNVRVVVTEAVFTFPRFDSAAQIQHMQCELTFKELRGARLTSEDVSADIEGRTGISTSDV